MKKLIHVVRGTPDIGVGFNIFNQQGEPATFRRHPEAIMTQELDQNANFQRHVEFCLCDERDVDQVVTALAQANPGVEVRAYNIEQIAQAPAGEVVRKKISASGVLPS